jgi:hypothetical protein
VGSDEDLDGPSRDVQVERLPAVVFPSKQPCCGIEYRLQKLQLTAATVRDPPPRAVREDIHVVESVKPRNFNSGFGLVVIDGWF